MKNFFSNLWSVLAPFLSALTVGNPLLWVVFDDDDEEDDD